MTTLVLKEIIQQAHRMVNMHILDRFIDNKDQYQDFYQKRLEYHQIKYVKYEYFINIMARQLVHLTFTNDQKLVDQKICFLVKK